MKIRKIRDIELMFAGAPGDGRHLELWESAVSDPMQLALIRADDDETKWLVLKCGKSLVQVPLAEFLDAVRLAESEDGVHGEAFYDLEP